jgi:hypothetical protein
MADEVVSSYHDLRNEIAENSNMSNEEGASNNTSNYETNAIRRIGYTNLYHALDGQSAILKSKLSPIFTLKPPAEYEELGRCLSNLRSEDAEAGEIHLTALTLARLFDRLVPRIDHLVRAYGLRSSEIAKSPSLNPQGGEKYGLFASRVGADGTSIWAAATLGNSAIAVHLLACMLASVWKTPQAISIWMELIEARKRELLESDRLFQVSQTIPMELTRDHIAKWHASAKAWLLTADQANESRRKRLLQVADSLGLSVSTSRILRENVIESWTSAMTTIDKLIQGIPQSVVTGAPLVGMAAWHLYPDMIAFTQDSEVQEIKQKDDLVDPGGILTVGIEDSRRRGQGIVWSLPLANLRYYGNPEISETCLSSQKSRIPVTQLIYVAIGSLIRRWCADANDIEDGLHLIIRLAKMCNKVVPQNRHESWLELLASAARDYFQADSDDRSEYLKLIKCGRRRYPMLLGEHGVDSMLGLSDCKTTLSYIHENQSRIDLLREVAKDFGDDRTFMIIQYNDFEKQGYQIASVERLKCGLKRPLNEDSVPRHFYRWITTARTPGLPSSFTRASVSPSEKDGSECIKIDFMVPLFYDEKYPASGFHWDDAPSVLYSKFLENRDPTVNWRSYSGANMRIQYLFGDPKVAALYSVTIDAWKRSPNEDLETFGVKNLRQLQNIFVLRHVLWAAENNLLNREVIRTHLLSGRYSIDQLGRKPSNSVFIETNLVDKQAVKSLKALLTVCELYETLPSATIDFEVASRPLHSHAWIPNYDISAFGPYVLSQEEVFSCVAMFESGGFNFDPTSMKGVFAIANGNSLYVAKWLLQDPCKPYRGSRIERVVGNLGRPGMTLLISPANPIIRDPTPNYSLVNHYPYDGTEVSFFKQTSLHLKITEWHRPIDTGSRGIKDIEAAYLEAAISVYDGKEWVADVRIDYIFPEDRHRSSRIVPNCTTRHEQTLAREDLGKYVAIDNWEELLDSPLEVGVLRAKGNWQARLAAAALSVQLGHETRILPEDVCWTCASSLSKLPLLQPDGNVNYLNNEDSGDEDDDVIGPVDSVAESDSEVEEFIAKSIRRQQSGGRRQDQAPSSKFRNGILRNQNIVYIL